MKLNALTLITIMAATASATKSFYDPSDDRTCTLGDDNTLTCVKGNDGNAPVIDTSGFQAKEAKEPEFQGGGAPADGKRDIAKRYPTCGLGGITGLLRCRAKCWAIGSCGGQCSWQGWAGFVCHCSAKC